MDKKWSCPACEYKSGRRSNIERHMERKHGDYGVPVLTQSQGMGLNDQAFPWNYRGPYFPQTSHEGFAKGTKEKKEESFISSYKFEDKRLGIYKKFRDATKLPPSEDRDLIVNDLMLQMERLSSNPIQFWLDSYKIMTSAKIKYQSPSDSVPTCQQENSKLMESNILNNSESSVKYETIYEESTLWNNLLLSIFLIVEQMRKQRRVGEAMTIAGGIGIAIVGMLVSVPPVSYAGLCVLGLGVVSIFWR